MIPVIKVSYSSLNSCIIPEPPQGEKQTMKLPNRENVSVRQRINKNRLLMSSIYKENRGRKEHKLVPVSSGFSKIMK